MAKVRDSSITVEDVKEYLATQDDFALELFVYNQARTLGLNATHGGTYEDPVTKKPRQYDVRAWIEDRNRRIDLAIECKSLRPSYPLLVSRIRRIAAESYHQIVYSFKRERGMLDINLDLVPARSVTLREDNSIYPERDYVGKSTSQIGRTERGDFVSGDAEVFEKWSQALSSADELISDATYHYERSEKKVFLTAVLPILVISDGTLWVADYSDEGVLESEPKQVDEALLYVGREYSRPVGISFNVSHLHVLTKCGVSAFLKKVVEPPGMWSAIFRTKVE
jgi:hypothetical protein